MKLSKLIVTISASLGLCAGLAAPAAAQTNPPNVTFSELNPPNPGRTPLFAGADVIVGVIPDIFRSSGMPTYQGNPVRGFAIGTTSCNQGDVPLLWFTGSAPDPNRNKHPVIGMNVFRYSTINGTPRFEQIGLSWLKHGFLALQENACGFGCSPTPSTTLGVGCSDPYSAGLNASQGRLGPRYQVNPLTGEFPYPVTNVPGAALDYGRRIVIKTADIRTDTNLDEQYWGEGQYVTPDDSASGNGLNNNSYRRLGNSGNTDLSAALTINFTSPTRQRRYGVEAWRDESGPGGTVNNNVNIRYVNIDRDPLNPGRQVERFIIAWQVIDLGNGTWDYHYAVQNANAETAARSFGVPVDECAGLTDVWYSQPRTHSGEPEDNSPAWANARSFNTLSWGASVVWNPAWTAPANTALSNPAAWNAARGQDNANAIRWGMMFSFGFRANRPPVAGNVELGLYKVVSPQTLFIPAVVPAGAPCPADLNCDGVVDFNDLLEYLNRYNAQLPSADLNGDGVVDFNDLLEYLNRYNTAC